MLEGVNQYYSDANDLQNVYGRIAGTPAINNVPIVNNIISGYIFDFSAHPYRNFQIYFHLNETYKIFIRTRNDQGFSNWEQIYPDYSDIFLGENGYIRYANGLTVQWGTGVETTVKSSIPIVFPITFSTQAAIGICIGQSQSTTNTAWFDLWTNSANIYFSGAPNRYWWVVLGY